MRNRNALPLILFAAMAWLVFAALSTAQTPHTTYAIRAEDGSGIVSVNGAAAHKASPKDIVIICAFIGLSQQELATYKPTLVYLDEQNNVIRTANTIPVQAA